MAALRDEIMALLTGDAELTALVQAAHIFDSDEMPRDGGGLKWAPKEADGVRLAPHLITRWRDSVAYQPEAYKLGAERQSLEIYAYQDSGYRDIEAALRRVKDLLHDRTLYPVDYQLVHVLYTFRSGEMVADEYRQAPMMFTRFSIIHV